MKIKQPELAVDVKNLTVKFGNFFAVNNISFSVKKGEIFGFLGANGAGKTTTIRVLCGLLAPSSGKLDIAGISTDDGEMAIKAKVGYMSQKFTLYNDLSIEENLSFLASLRKIKMKTYLERRDSILKFIKFERPLSTLVKNLAAGTKQQISLAASILHEPEIVFLDEPTAGVTPASRARFWALIRQLAQDGKTIFVTTHYLDEAEQCERIALMSRGEIIALDSPTELKKQVFPDELFELNPFKAYNYNRMQDLKSHSAMSYFEPYGLRFHACFHKTKEGEQLQKNLASEFEITRIQPSLEDVFIQLVEGKGR